jgi:N-acetylglucosaminyldiphosphoundecaprenol N-acetyl-beta-D-mannosaminyltransferase
MLPVSRNMTEAKDRRAEKVVAKPRSHLAGSNGRLSPVNRVDILGVQVACVDADKLLEVSCTWAGETDRRTIMYVNAHCLNLAWDDLQYRQILNQADLVYADGISVELANRVLGGCKLRKATASDWFDDFCRMAADNRLRLYIFAGRPGVAKRARDNLISRWPGLEVVGAADGYFHEMDEAEVLEDIERKAPQVLFVGRGSPLQEKWIARHREAIDVQVCWGIGSMFDLIAGVEAWPPDWLNALGMQWFWRLLMNPAGKWRRYVLGNPIFVSRVLRQKWIK